MELPHTNLTPTPTFPNEKAHEEKKLPMDVAKCNALEMAESAVEVKEDVPLIKRRWVGITGCCMGAACIVALFLGLLILTLTLTLFRRHNPIITVTQVHLRSLKVDNLNMTELAEAAASGRLRLDPTDPASSLMSLMAGSPLNLTNVRMHVRVDVEVMVYNPNRASFRYTSGMSHLYYRGMEVGQAAVHPGRIGARGFEALNTTMSLNVTASSLLNNPNLFLDVAAGSFPMYATAHVSGHINFLNVFKHHARTSTLCTMSVSIALRTFENLTCTYKVRL